jgi:hypothetical protein
MIVTAVEVVAVVVDAYPHVICKVHILPWCWVTATAPCTTPCPIPCSLPPALPARRSTPPTCCHCLIGCCYCLRHRPLLIGGGCCLSRLHHPLAQGGQLVTHLGLGRRWDDLRRVGANHVLTSGGLWCRLRYDTRIGQEATGTGSQRGVQAPLCMLGTITGCLTSRHPLFTRAISRHAATQFKARLVPPLTATSTAVLSPASAASSSASGSFSAAATWANSSWPPAMAALASAAVTATMRRTPLAIPSSLSSAKAPAWQVWVQLLVRWW